MSEKKLPAGWAWATVDEFASLVQYGSSAKASEEQGGVPILRMGNIVDGRLDTTALKFLPAEHPEFPELLLEPGDVLFNRTNSAELVGKTAVYGGAPSPCSFASYLIRVRLKPPCAPSYLSWYINSVSGRQWIASVVNQQVGQANVNGSKLRALRIPLPPRAEQDRIVGEIDKQFSRIDAGVAALRRIQANLKRHRAAILKAACEGRLVPTEAELARAEGRSYEPAEKLLERILEERRARWEAEQLAKMKAKGKRPKNDRREAKYERPKAADRTKLPALPEGWTWATWDQIGTSQNGRPFPSDQYQQHGVKLLRPGNLHASGCVTWTESNTRCLDERWAEESPAHVVGPQELVMNLTAQSLRDEFLGRVCMTGPADRCLLNQRIARLTPVKVNARYILWMFKSPMFRRFVDGLNTGSLIQHMFTSQLADFCVPLPPLAEQVRIAASVETHLSFVEAIADVVEANLARADRLRQAVLQRAFEGKLVPQDPSDEPASTLLDRLRTERAHDRPDEPKRRPTRRRPAPAEQSDPV